MMNKITNIQIILKKNWIKQGYTSYEEFLLPALKSKMLWLHFYYSIVYYLYVKRSSKLNSLQIF